VFQFGDLVPELTIAENVDCRFMLAGARKRDTRTAVLDLLGRLGIAELPDRPPGPRLGRTGPARGCRPRLRAPARRGLRDEPTGALDQSSGALVLRRDGHHLPGTRYSVVLVTHEESVPPWPDRRLHMSTAS